VSDQAIIRTGGKQYRVATGDVLRVEKLDGEVGSRVTFDEVLLLGSGESVRIGTPHVAGAKVTAEIQRHGRGEKLVVYKFRRRKNYRRRNGHRQAFTEVRVTGIEGRGAE
jgi:large subunit ribosomal protein L21